MQRTACILAAALPAAAFAQTNIAADQKHSWSENTGWMNWRDAGNGAHGVRVHGTHLTGWIWSENLGWIAVGHGPASGSFYTNIAPDFGVNITASGATNGLAWSENAGWINFSTLSIEPLHARIDAQAGRFRGYAWGENIGWINLDHPSAFVAFNPGAGCYANCDSSTTAPTLNVADFTCFLQRFAGGESYANCDQSTTAPTLNVADFTCFLQRFAAGCG
jgi:hypothetical protein